MPARKIPARKAKGRSPLQRRRRTYGEMYLDALASLSNNGQQMVSNQNLRNTLSWDDGKYARIKSQLVADGSVVVGKGWGGSVGLARGAENDALKLFISYSHQDEELKDALVKHLRPLERMKLIASWHDRKLLAGDDWGDMINRNLEQADIVLLLVSIDFINSKYCYDIELDKALERDDQKSCKVIPIILRGCLWHQTPFAKLQALPRDGKPVTSWADRDEALAAVADGIRQLAEELMASK